MRERIIEILKEADNCMHFCKLSTENDTIEGVADILLNMYNKMKDNKNNPNYDRCSFSVRTNKDNPYIIAKFLYIRENDNCTLVVSSGGHYYRRYNI